MIVEATAIPDVKIITPRRFGDHRGYFAETYSRRSYMEVGVGPEFVQDNHSLSSKIGTVRGLHFQKPPHAQDKLVRCGRGAIFDVAVDLRKGSPTFGRWVGVELSSDNGKQLFVPVGFGHGFVTILPDSEIIYKCSDYYFPEDEGAVCWNDPAIGIGWPIEGEAIVSAKDAMAPTLGDLDNPFIWEG